jgi:CHRD domain
MVVKSSSIVQASVISALLLVSAISMIQSGTAQVQGKFTADLQPREGSSASGKATLELQGEDKTVMYTITGTRLNNITGVAISQETGTGRAPDVVTIRTASQSGIEPSSGEREIAKGNFTASDLMGPLQGKSLADFVKAIDDGKIIIRVSTGPYPLGEIYGNVTAGE